MPAAQFSTVWEMLWTVQPDIPRSLIHSRGKTPLDAPKYYYITMI